MDPDHDRTVSDGYPNAHYTPNQYAQPQYGQPQSSYAPVPGHQGGPHAAGAQGQKHRTTSVVLGVVGLFLLGIVLGPLAIWQAGKAERLGVKATAGKVLGWIALVGGVLGMFLLSGGAFRS